MERVDIVVVGGGPAGARAGETAAREGADVRVIEKGVPREDRTDLGPDSTDAAGMLDYWVDILGIPFEEIPDDIILQELSGSEFIAPNATCTLHTTGMDASYDGFGFTFDRAAMDDYLRERAEDAGAEYRVGTGVTGVESALGGGHEHYVTLADGSEIVADYLICADGPQRTITSRVLDQFLPEDTAAMDVIGPREHNHIAYQEYRRMPEACFEPEMLKFWWGFIPGETAYPWVFPNDDRVARIGLTMPMALDFDAVEDRDAYPLLDPSDEQLPSGSVYLRRLLEREYGDRYDIDADLPLVEDRGKQGGTEAYAISSTRPIDSPTAAGVAVAGGAMGTTSAFHEGGYHVASRSGAIAGELAATDRLGRYNHAWREAIGDEILRNVSFADVVQEYTPADWDRAFATAQRMIGNGTGDRLIRHRVTAGPRAIKYLLQYRWAKFGYRDGRFVQFRESQYEMG